MERSKERLFKEIINRLPKNVLLVEDIADVLELSYDAAYRRLKGKTNLSFEEALKLAKHYDISLNSLYGFSKENHLKVYKNDFRNSSEGLYDFFNSLCIFLKSFNKKSDNGIFYYAAKDVPIYHTPTTTLYGKFRLYAYLNILSDFSVKNFVSFKNFIPPAKVVEESLKFKKMFKGINAVEIWSDTTINSLLYQVYYFYEAKFIDKFEALHMCEEIRMMIENIELSSRLGEWGQKGNKLKYELYYNKLISLSNATLFKSEKQKVFFVPYTDLSHFRIDDEITNEEADYFFKKQLQFSKKLSGDGSVERKMFFNSMYDKIQQLKDQIEVKSSISFI